MSKEEIYTDVYDELMTPDYINPDWLVGQPEMVYRLDRGGKRWYYTLSEDGIPTFYISCTTFIKMSLPTSPFLIKWMVDQGEDSKDIAQERADYGTFLHIQCGRLLQDATYDLDLLGEHLKAYIEEHHLDRSFMQHAEPLKKDILAFAQFVIDRNVVPIAIEIILTDKERGLASSLDLVCEMDVEEKVLTEEVYKSGPRAGQKKEGKQVFRRVAIIDIKSGKKGFFESHELQLAEYRNMWTQNFPDIKVDYLFNWSPKDWRGTTPSYNLKDQTNAKSAQKLDLLVKIAKIEDSTKENSITMCHGIIDVKNGLMSNIEHVEMADLIKKRHTLTEDDL